jgi:Tol biopolymer transport system component
MASRMHDGVLRAARHARGEFALTARHPGSIVLRMIPLGLAVMALALAACGGGGGGSPAPTPLPAGDVSLIYTQYVPPAQPGGATEARLFSWQQGEVARLVKDYPGSAIVYMLASPDGRMIAFVDNGIMKIVDRATGADVMVLSTPPVSTTGAGPFASWTADSKKFAYSRVNYTGTPIAGIPNGARSGWIEIIDVGSKENITPEWTKVVPAAQPSWDPTGDEFVAVDFGTPDSTSRPLIIGGVDKRRRTLTTEPAGNKAAPLWSPDGKHIAYWVLEQVPDNSGNTVPGGIFVVDADGKNPHFLAQATFVSPQGWSPDGKRLAIACPPEGKTTQDKITHICIVDVGSGKLTRLTSGQTDFSAGFSPDGDTVAYLSDPDPTSGTFTLRTIRISDKHEERIATGVPYGGFTWARSPQ